MDDTLGWILTKDLGDPTIFLRIVEVMKNHPNAFDGSELAVIESLSKHHDVCRVNRNVFIHVVAIGPNDDGGAFFARKNKKRMDHILIGGDLATLRSIANEIIELENFMDDINSYFYERNGAHPSTLPDIPSLPESRQELRPSIPPERRRSPPPSQN